MSARSETAGWSFENVPLPILARRHAGRTMNVEQRFSVRSAVNAACTANYPKRISCLWNDEGKLKLCEGLKRATAVTEFVTLCYRSNYSKTGRRSTILVAGAIERPPRRFVRREMLRHCLPLRSMSHIQVSFSLWRPLDGAPQLVHHAAISARDGASACRRTPGLERKI